MIDSRPIFEELLLLPLGKAAGNDDPSRSALAFQLQHLVDRRKRFGPRPLDEAAGVDHDEIGSVRIAHQLVTVELQEAEHSLAVDRVFWTAEADKGVAAFGVGGCWAGGRRLARYHK